MPNRQVKYIRVMIRGGYFPQQHAEWLDGYNHRCIRSGIAPTIDAGISFRNAQYVTIIQDE